MALDDTYNITRPGQLGGTGAVDALHVEEYGAEVERTIMRKSALQGRIKLRPVKGTSIISNFGTGKSTLQTLVPGVQPDGTVNNFGKVSLQIDTTVLARNIVPLLDDFQSSINARVEIGHEHGSEIAKFQDQSFFIQALRAANRTSSAYSGLAGAGHLGGTQVTLGNPAAHLDPALLYNGLLEMFTGMREKDVDPQMDDVILAVRPREFSTLMQNEQLIRSDFITSAGNSVAGYVLKAMGVPVIQSNNLPTFTSVVGHRLSNANNGNAYDGDFTNDVAVAFSPRALMGGSTIPLSTKVFFDDNVKCWFIDAWLAYGITVNRAEFAAVLKKPA